MDNGTQTALTLRRLPQGGYVVCDEHRPEMFTSEYFASTSIDEALEFMRDKIKPIGAALPNIENVMNRLRGHD